MIILIQQIYFSIPGFLFPFFVTAVSILNLLNKCIHCSSELIWRSLNFLTTASLKCPSESLSIAVLFGSVPGSLLVCLQGPGSLFAGCFLWMYNYVFALKDYLFISVFFGLFCFLLDMFA